MGKATAPFTIRFASDVQASEVDAFAARHNLSSRSNAINVLIAWGLRYERERLTERAKR